MTTAIILLALMVPLLFLSGLASGTETALFSLGTADRRSLAAQHPASSRSVERLLSRPRRLLVLLLLVNMGINVTYFTLSTLASLAVNDAVLATIIGIGSLITIILVGEVLAKTLAAGHRIGMSRLVAPMFSTLDRVGGVLIVPIERFGVAPIVRLVGTEVRQTQTRELVGELVEVVDAGAEDGLFSGDEQQILREVVSLRRRPVREIMTPRLEMRIVSDLADTAQLQRAWSMTDGNWLAVSAGSLDDSLPMVIEGDVALGVEPAKRESLLQKPTFVPERAKLDQIVDLLRTSGAGALLCVDEHGRVAGMVDRTDVIDEVVLGARRSMAGSITREGEGTWSMPGGVPLSELAEQTGDAFFDELDRDEPTVTTIGGLITARLGRVARLGDAGMIDAWSYRIRAVRGRRIQLLDLQREDVDDAPAGGSDEGAEP